MTNQHNNFPNNDGDEFSHNSKTANNPGNRTLSYQSIFTGLGGLKQYGITPANQPNLPKFGSFFFWEKRERMDLIIYAQHEMGRSMIPEKLIQICRFSVKKNWLGTGWVTIDWPLVQSKLDPTRIVLCLYQHSTDPNELKNLPGQGWESTSFLGALLLDSDESKKFKFFAERRFRT